MKKLAICLGFIILVLLAINIYGLVDEKNNGPRKIEEFITIGDNDGKYYFSDKTYLTRSNKLKIKIDKTSTFQEGEIALIIANDDGAINENMLEDKQYFTSGLTNEFNVEKGKKYKLAVKVGVLDGDMQAFPTRIFMTLRGIKTK